MIQPYLRKLSEGKNLTRAEASRAMGLIVEGSADDAQIAAFAMGLRLKGETAEEIAGCAEALRARSEKVPLQGLPPARLLDTCGTGGDSLGTINVSTLAAFVAAGAGVPVAKHGNRSATGRCGSADLLEALGVPLDVAPAQAAECLRRTGLVFLFAPRFHPALRHAAAARRSLGMRTIFNLIGPLCNPAGAGRQLMGVFDGRRLAVIARVLRSLGVRDAMLVHGGDGMDELTVTGVSQAVRLRQGSITSLRVTPESAGLRRWRLSALKGGGAETNAARALAVLEGGRGAAREITLLNAGAALMVAGAASSLKEGAALAAESIDQGKARAKLEEVRSFLLRETP